MYSLCGKTDDELTQMGYPQAAMLIPKMCLVLAVMGICGFAAFEFRPTVGSTLGMFAHEELWSSVPQSKL